MTVTPIRKPIDAEMPAPLTETGAAERFARLHGDDVRYDHLRRRWLLWSTHRWVPDHDGEIVRLGISFARTWQRETLDISDHEQRAKTFKEAVKLERRDALLSMLALASNVRPIADAGDRWDRDPFLLGVPNGVVHLFYGDLQPGRRDDRITMCTSVAYDHQAESSKWTRALESIIEDEHTREFLHVALGYSCTGDTSRDCWFLAQGGGGNGKSTVYRPVQRALGDYAAEVPAALFDSRRDRTPYDLAVLPGRRFVLSSETGNSIRLHHDRIKQITGGDSVRAERKYENSFEFKPVCKLWLTANHKPVVTDDSPAFWRRVRLIPFTSSFVGREEQGLRASLEEDPEHQAAILAWLVRGAVKYQRDGLAASSSVDVATREFERESDPLDEFITEACDLDLAVKIRAGELFEHYKQWANRRGLSAKEQLASNTFGLRVKAQFPHERTSRGIVYRGLARRPL